MRAEKKILIIAGEASGDIIGADLLAELKKRNPGLESFGVGSVNLAHAGHRILFDASEINIVGLTGAIANLPRIYSRFQQVVSACREEKPTVAVLIDLPDFNLRIAKKLKRLGIPVIYYVSPQVWVWRKNRIKAIKALVSHMLVLYPFEKDFYVKHGVPVTFVGHPLAFATLQKKTHRSTSEILKNPRIALLPGSRTSELEHIAPLLADLSQRLFVKFPAVELVVPVAPTLSKEAVSHFFNGTQVKVVQEKTQDVLNFADVAVIASGTATLEAALVGLPFLLVYKVGSLNAFLFRWVVRWKGWIGLANLLKGKEVVREFFQENASVENIEAECISLLSDEKRRSIIVRELEECRDLLNLNSSQMAADVITPFLER